MNSRFKKVKKMKTKIFILFFCILNCNAILGLSVKDSLTHKKYDSLKLKVEYEMKGHKSEGKVQINLLPESNFIKPSYVQPQVNNGEGNEPTTYGPYPGNDPSPVVSDLCSDGNFDNSNLTNFGWDFVPNNRVLEGDDNDVYRGLTFNTNFPVSKFSNKAFDIGSKYQSASGFLWSVNWTYSANNKWELTNYNDFDSYFKPKSNIIYNSGYPPINFAGLRKAWSGKALKLNDSIGHFSASTISKKITVTSSNFIYFFKYALVFSEYDGGHQGGNPFFGVRTFNSSSNEFEFLPFGPIYDARTKTPTNTWIQYYPTNPLVMTIDPNPLNFNPFLAGKFWGQNNDYVHCKPWSCGSINLSKFIGQTINLEFIVGDCYQGSHFGYAYIDDICGENDCVDPGGVLVHPSEPCGLNAKLEGSYKHPKNNSTGVYYSLDSITIDVYKNTTVIYKFRIPDNCITKYTINGNYSKSLYDIYEKVKNISPTNQDCLFFVAKAYYNNGPIDTSKSFISPKTLPHWCFCCDSASNPKLFNFKYNYDEVTDQNCKLTINVDKDSIKFKPNYKPCIGGHSNNINYFVSNAKIYEELLSANTNKGEFNPSLYKYGFNNYPAKIDSFNFYKINLDSSCGREYKSYEIIYKHPICQYFTKLKIETTCKVPLVCENVTCLPKDSVTLNPYLTNLMGNWRPSESFIYNVKRNDLNPKNYRVGQFYKFFDPVFSFSGGNWILNPQLGGTKWIKKDKILNYDNSGNDIENINPLSVYSTKKFAYNNSLTHLIASNAKFEEVMYYSFEKLDHNNNHLEFGIPNGALNNTFLEKMNKAIGTISTEEAHTGSTSYKVVSTTSNFTDTPFVSTISFLCGTPSDEGTPNYQIKNGQIRANENTFKPVFELKPNNTYSLSYWVKNALKTETALGYISVQYECNGTLKRFLSSINAGNIEGWYQINAAPFTIPANAKLVKLVFYPSQGGTYFDDIRIHPTDANMKSYVYNTQLKLTSELDESNYATFYDYDDEGNLIRVRKETERGIITIKENKISLRQE